MKEKNRFEIIKDCNFKTNKDFNTIYEYLAYLDGLQDGINKVQDIEIKVEKETNNMLKKWEKKEKKYNRGN